MNPLTRRSFLKTCGFAVAGLSLVCRQPERFSRFAATVSDSLDEKIGQMLLAGFRGLEVDKNHPIVRDIRQRHLGGVVLFDYDVPLQSPVRNVSSSGQIKKLTADLQFYSKLPLLVAIDYEGGRISRLKEKNGFPATLSAQSLGERDVLDLTFSQAESMAELLLSLGVNLNLAPVVDLNSNPENPVIGGLERSFSSDPEKVTAHAARFIQAFHDKNVLCALKHFPGHGSSANDSHLGLVDISETWKEDELIPYAKLIAQKKVDAVMTAHVFNRHLDPSFPATLSRRVITGLLREKLEYSGVVLSDDLQMGAIAKEYGLEEAVLKTIEAGVDILVFANNSIFDEKAVSRAAKIIKNFVQTNRISEKRIDESYARIMNLKKGVSNGEKS